MSWDIIILKEQVPLPLGELSLPLGEASDVRPSISRTLPETDWSNPKWGTVAGKNWGIDFNLMEPGRVFDFMLHVHGGAAAIRAILKLCRENDWVALDTTTGKYLELTKHPKSERDNRRWPWHILLLLPGIVAVLMAIVQELLRK